MKFEFFFNLKAEEDTKIVSKHLAPPLLSLLPPCEYATVLNQFMFLQKLIVQKLISYNFIHKKLLNIDYHHPREVVKKKFEKKRSVVESF